MSQPRLADLPRLFHRDDGRRVNVIVRVRMRMKVRLWFDCAGRTDASTTTTTTTTSST